VRVGRVHEDATRMLATLVYLDMSRWSGVSLTWFQQVVLVNDTTNGETDSTSSADLRLQLIYSCYKVVANILVTCYEDVKSMLTTSYGLAIRGSYEETAPMKFSLKRVGAGFI